MTAARAMRLAVRWYWPEIVGGVIGVALALSTACGRGPACPRAIGNGDVRQAPQYPRPAVVYELRYVERRPCAHQRRLPVPPAPMLAGDAAVDAIRLGEYARKLELFAALDWAACGGGEP